jgi:hypothetical protein
MEMATMETETMEPAGEAAAATASVSGTTVTPEASMEERAESHPEVSAQVVAREAMIEDDAPLRSAPMLEAGSSSCGVLELMMMTSMTQLSYH